MTFYMPTLIYEEQNCVQNHASDLVKFGQRALVVTGHHSAIANGSLLDVDAALRKVGISYCTYSDIEQNPSVESIMKARDYGAEEEVDFVIGIGGGSPMDSAKAIALMIRNKDKGADYLYEKGNPVDALPVVAVPTTCGTGSEVTGIAVLTRHDIETKASIPYLIFPDLALVDPAYLKFAPETVLRNTACDALCHLSESYLNAKASDFSRMCSDAGLALWKRSLPVLTGDRNPSDEDYASLIRTSTIAGMAIAQTGTAIPHGLSYGLTYDMHIAHGRACGQYLGGYLAEAPAEDRDHILGLSGLETLDGYLSYFAKSCGVVEVSDEENERIVSRMLENPSKMATAPFPVDEAMLRRITAFTK